MKKAMPAAIPEVPVKDMNEAVTYYAHRLGFSIDWRADDIGLAGVSNGDCRLFLADDRYRMQRGNVSPIVIWLNVDSEDEVDSMHELWHGLGAMILSGPERKPWGLHEFSAKDPDGNVFRVFYDFATPAGELE